MITFAKCGSSHAGRQAPAYIYDEDVALKLFDDITPNDTEETANIQDF